MLSLSVSGHRFPRRTELVCLSRIVGMDSEASSILEMIVSGQACQTALNAAVESRTCRLAFVPMETGSDPVDVLNFEFDKNGPRNLSLPPKHRRIPLH